MVTRVADENDRPSWATLPTQQVRPLAERMAETVAAKNEELGFAGDGAQAWHELPTGFYRGLVTGLRGLW